MVRRFFAFWKKQPLVAVFQAWFRLGGVRWGLERFWELGFLLCRVSRFCHRFFLGGLKILQFRTILER